MSIINLKDVNVTLSPEGGSPEPDVRGSVLGKVKIIYAENILPTEFGFTGVRFRKVFTPAAGVKCDSLHLLYNADGTASYFIPNNGDCLILDDTSSVNWKSYYLGNFAGQPSIATVLGRTFICWPGQGIFEYNKTAQTLAPIHLHGLFSTNLTCITSAYNYLIATDGQIIYWSSAIDPQEFTPLLTTGAGSAIPQARKTQIRYLTPAEGGFHVHTTSGVIYAKFLQNEQIPWAFDEVFGSGGFLNSEYLAPEYAITNHGLQNIVGQKSATVHFPPLDRRKVYTYVGLSPFGQEFSQEGFARESETWGSKPVGPHFLDEHVLELLPRMKLFRLADKYLVLSVALKDSKIFNLAYVYDFKLKTFGCINIPHVDVVGSPLPPALVSASLQYLQFLTPDGALVIAEPFGGIGKVIISPVFSNFGKSIQLRAISIPGFSGTLDILSSDTPLDYSGQASEQSAVRTIAARAFGKFEFLATAKYHTLLLSGHIENLTLLDVDFGVRQ